MLFDADVAEAVKAPLPIVAWQTRGVVNLNLLLAVIVISIVDCHTTLGTVQTQGSPMYVCVCVCAPKEEKRLELRTPSLVHVYFVAGSRHALTLRSKGQRSRHSVMKCASDIGMRVDMTA